MIKGTFLKQVKVNPALGTQVLTCPAGFKWTILRMLPLSNLVPFIFTQVYWSKTSDTKRLRNPLTGRTVKDRYTWANRSLRSCYFWNNLYLVANANFALALLTVINFHCSQNTSINNVITIFKVEHLLIYL